MRSTFAEFGALFAADLVARSAYLAGKSPVLPIFADALGANTILLGAIVSISSITGVLLKPVFGLLSDRRGRIAWLAIGTALFALTPVLYVGVDTSAELVAVRLVHGLATAIYGPVTLAFVADLSGTGHAERYGWFGMARAGAQIIGPLLGGALLIALAPTQVYLVTGLIALLAFVPVAFLATRPPARDGRRRRPPQAGRALRTILENRHLTIFAAIEMTSQIGVYAVKAFFPLMILNSGGTPLEAGLFLSVQEAASLAVRVPCGRLADRTGRPRSVAAAGLLCLGIALIALPHTLGSGSLIAVAVAIGSGKGAYAPCALSLIAQLATSSGTAGAAFGVAGAMRNLGKLLGPLSAGLLIYWFGEHLSFALLGLVPVTTVLALATITRDRNAADASATRHPWLFGR